MDEYSPFNGVVGKIISLFISFGSSGIIIRSYNDFVKTMGKFAFWVPILFVVVMFVFDFILELYKTRLINIAERTLPDNIMKTWQEENTKQYRKILKSFLINAIEIQNYYYPEEKIFSQDVSNMSKEQLDYYLEKVLDKHMLF